MPQRTTKTPQKTTKCHKNRPEPQRTQNQHRAQNPQTQEGH